MKAKTKLTKQQQLITRAFLDVVLTDNKALGDGPADLKATTQYCFTILGYQRLTNGAAIPLGVEVKTPYGEGFSGETYKDYPDQYVADGKELRGTVNSPVSGTRKSS